MWPWSEDEWQARFDAVNHWVYSTLPETNPVLMELLWQCLTQVATELRPDQIFGLAAWFRDVLQGAALIAEEDGLTLTGGTPGSDPRLDQPVDPASRA
jgi:hypothetical protein